MEFNRRKKKKNMNKMRTWPKVVYEESIWHTCSLIQVEISSAFLNVWEEYKYILCCDYTVVITPLCYSTFLPLSPFSLPPLPITPFPSLYILLFFLYSTTHSEVEEQVKAGYRMPKPDGCPDVLYDLMLATWNKEPRERPSFEHLKDVLKD